VRGNWQFFSSFRFERKNFRRLEKRLRRRVSQPEPEPEPASLPFSPSHQEISERSLRLDFRAKKRPPLLSFSVVGTYTKDDDVAPVLHFCSRGKVIFLWLKLPLSLSLGRVRGVCKVAAEKKSGGDAWPDMWMGEGEALLVDRGRLLELCLLERQAGWKRRILMGLVGKMRVESWSPPPSPLCSLLHSHIRHVNFIRPERGKRGRKAVKFVY